jgi:hypothetical protein
MLKDDGTYDHIAWVPSKEESGKGGLAGLALDRADNIYVIYYCPSNRFPNPRVCLGAWP